MTVGVSVLVDEPGANKLLTAALTCRTQKTGRDVTDDEWTANNRAALLRVGGFGRRTLSRERPGGREGEEGNSRPRGFFGFGGATSDVVVTAEDAVAGGRAGSDRDNMVRKLVVGPLVAASGTGSQYDCTASISHFLLPVGVSLHSPVLAGC